MHIEVEVQETRKTTVEQQELLFPADQPATAAPSGGDVPDAGEKLHLSQVSLWDTLSAAHTQSMLCNFVLQTHSVMLHLQVAEEFWDHKVLKLSPQ